MHRLRFTPLLFAVLALVLTACPSTGGSVGGAPQITSFTANPESITAPGQAVALSWEISGGVTSLEIDQGVGAVSGTSEVVYPTAATTYTLTASNSSGSTSASVIVALGAGTGPGVEDGLPPSGTFGVSLTQGDFQSDQGSNIEDASDPRIIRVQPGGTFYALVSYSDPGGIAGATIFIANSSPPGLRADLVQGQSVGGFTLNGEVGGCLLDGSQVDVTCIYEIAVGDIPNITALPGVSGEFAYVFRVRVTDAAGNVSDSPPRGYVVVGDSGGTPTPPGNPDPPGTPNPPANRAPNADFSSEQQNGTLTVAFNAALSSDPDGDSLTYAWEFGDGSRASSRNYRKTYRSARDYQVSLTVTDPDNESDTETKTITVQPAGGGTPTPATYTLTVAEPENGTVTSEPGDIDCGSTCSEEYDESEEVTLTAVADDDYKFDSWGGECEGTTGITCTVTMSANKTVTATFSAEVTIPAPPYQLTVTKPENGMVTSTPQGIECGDKCTASYPPDEEVELTANPDEGYEFDSWGGVCEGMTDATCTVTMDGAKTVTVNFRAELATPTPYTLTVTKPENGTVTSEPGDIDCGSTCSEEYDESEEVTLTAVADDDYKFDSWGGECEGTTGITCTVTMSANKTVTVTFDEEETTPEDGEGSDLKADFEYTSSNMDFEFISNTEGSNGEVLSYSWDFGDSRIGSGAKTSHTYAEVGTYKVFLTVRTDDGATSRASKDVTVTN